MCPIPIIFYWRMSGLWEVEWWMPFNLHYYFLHSIAAAGRLQSFDRDLQNIQIYNRSKPSLHNFNCLLPLLNTSLAVLLLYPGTKSELRPNASAMDAGEMLSWFIVSFNSETSSFWKSVTRHATVVCPTDTLPLCLGFVLSICPHQPLCSHAGALTTALRGAKNSAQIVQKDVLSLKCRPGSHQSGREQCWMRKAMRKNHAHKPSLEMQPQFPLLCLEMVQDVLQSVAGPVETPTLKTREVQF